MEKAARPGLRLVHGAPGSSDAGAVATLASIFRGSRGALIRMLMLQTASPAEAEDIAQTAYMKLHAKAGSLSASNLRSLLFVTARNLAIDLRRQQKRARKVVDDSGDDNEQISQIPTPYPDVERWMIARERVQTVMDLIAELPPKCRHAFVAYKLDDRDYGSIASEMGVSESMVRKYVIRAVSHCARRFDELEGWE